jgi:signal peptidase II
MKRPFGLLLTIAAVVVALDVWTKRWATRVLEGAPPMPVIGDLVRFNYARNSGVAFGIGAGLPFPYYLFSLAAIVAILYLVLVRRVQGSGRQLALALILGGAIGNLLDRVTSGEVVDFIEIGWRQWRWPVFNVADSAVSIGVVLFALTWPHHVPPPPVAAEAGAGTDSPGGEPPATSGTLEHDSGAGPLGPAALDRGAAGPLPGRGADGPVA